MIESAPGIPPRSVRTSMKETAVTALDLLTLLCLVVAVSIVLFGGIRFFAGTTRITATSAWRVLALAGLAAIVRHVLRPNPSVIVRVRDALDRARSGAPSPAVRAVTPLWIASRLGVIAIAFIGLATIGVVPQAARLRVSDNALWNLPYRWDTGWYLAIAADGYGWNRRAAGVAQQPVAFFPAYPMLMRVGGALLGAQPGGPRTLEGAARLRSRTLMAGWLLALASSYAAFLGVYRWAADVAGRRVALTAVALMSAYPFAVYFSAAYTEPIFLLSTVSAFIAMRTARPLAAGGWGLFAGLLRPNGFLLALPLIVMAGQQRPFDRRLWIAAVMPAIGMLIFSAYLFSLTGRPLAWMEAHAAWGRTAPTWEGNVAQPLAQMAAEGAVNYVMTAPYQVLNAGALLFAFALLPAVWRRLGAAPALLVVVTVVPPLFAGGVMSMGRFTSTLFPVFVALAAVTPRRHVPALLVLFALGQGLAAVLFFTWRPLV
jgi:Gpi18-like mannosyltransferase